MKARYCLPIVCLVLMAGFGSPVVADDDKSPAESKSVWVTSIAQRGDSTAFVAATADGLLLREASVVSFDASDPAKLTPLYSHAAAVWCVDATSDGGTVASVDYRGNLVLFDAKSGKPTTHEKAFERWCQAMMISADDKLVLAGNEAGKVMVWDIAAGKVTKSIELDGHAVTGLAVSPDQSMVAASDGAGHVHLLKWPELEAIAEIKVSEETAWCVAFANDGKHFFVGSSDRNLYRCEAKADAKPESVAKGTDWITQLAVSPGGQVAAAEVGGKLHFPSLGGTDSMDAKSGVWALSWDGDEQLFAGTRKDGIAIAGRSWKWAQSAAARKAAEEKAIAEAKAKAEAMAAEEKAAEEKAAAAKVALEKKKAEEAKAAAAKKKEEAKKKAEAEAAKKAAAAKKVEDEKKAAEVKKAEAEKNAAEEKAAKEAAEKSENKDE